MPQPSGTVTFLFTDIEGSTRLWEQHSEPMRAALARHDAILRQAIEQNNGHVFKTVGDAFCAAFATATEALKAALAGQQALQAETWPEPVTIKVRMALHTGVAEQRDDDYFGPPLNRVARLLAIGYGGQVLLSDVTQDLTRDSLPPSVTLKSLGDHRLKDLNRPETVFQLLHPDLPAEFPPLRSLDNPQLPNNLPIQLTSFIGREKEIAEVKALLSKTRLLTLTGSGGCGKTRLALQVAAEVLEEYLDGVWLVELAALSDPTLVPQAVAQALNLREEPGKSLTQSLIDTLKSQRALLVLDNCEHLLAACAQLVDTLLRACPQVKVLASSREGLNVAGELTYRVPSLSLTQAGEPISVESLSQSEAARLFIARALFHQPAFAVTAQNAPALAGICQRLDGIPLAIELAAARIRSLTPEQIASRLDNRFRLLTGGSRSALPRQQTLRAAIDWSYDLLTETEKALLGRLSVFAGGWTLEAAEAVGIGDDVEAWEILDLLTSLVDKSLVVAEREEAHTRYRFLETVRQYARERLEERGESAQVRERHQAFFVGLAEAAAPQLWGAQQAEWLQHLESEHDNLRAALEWEQNEAALRIAGALWLFWGVRGDYSEGRERLSDMLASAVVQAHTPARAKALHGAGYLAFWQGDCAAAGQLFEASLAMTREIGDKPGIAASLMSLGNVASAQCDYAAAHSLFEQSLALYRELGDKRNISSTLLNLGTVVHEQGDYTASRALYEESLALFREIGDKLSISNALYCLGNVADALCDYAAAHSLYEESLALYRKLGDKRGISNALNNLGNVFMKQGDYAEARALYEESLALYRKLGDKRGSAYSLEAFADLAWAQEPSARAPLLWGAAEALREGIGAPLPPSERTRYDQQVAQVRSVIGEDAFAAAWAEGRAMTLEQVVKYALEEPDDA